MIPAAVLSKKERELQREALTDRRTAFPLVTGAQAFTDTTAIHTLFELLRSKSVKVVFQKQDYEALTGKSAQEEPE